MNWRLKAIYHGLRMTLKMGVMCGRWSSMWFKIAWVLWDDRLEGPK